MIFTPRIWLIRLVLQYRKRGGSGGRIYTFERLTVFIVCVGYNLLVVVPNSD